MRSGYIGAERVIPPADIQRALEATDILRLVEQYLRLRRSGKEWFGLCPFHKEDTPSFSVNPAKKAYLCRGCARSGNAIGFVMEMERIRFPEAVRLLADRAGITVGDVREDTTAAARQLAAEATWFFGEVRYRYAKRQALRVHYRNAMRYVAAVGDQERYWVHMKLYRRFARSAARWDRIIARLDGARKPDLLARYVGIRERHPEVANAYRAARELEDGCRSVESRAVGAVGELTDGRFLGLLGTVAARLASRG